MWLLLACVDEPAPDPVDTAGGCEAGDPVAFAALSHTEGITFSDGRLFVTSPDGLFELDDSGNATSILALEQSLGLAPSTEGVLVADPGEFTFDGSGSDGKLLHVAFGGEPTILATGMPNPNFLANLDGTLLVSDDTAAIYANGATWLDTVPSPNGMGIAGDTLYVVSTFEPEPPLWAVPLTDGVPGAPLVVTRFDTGSAPDGLALDVDGGVWVALNLAGEVVRVDPTTGTITDRITGLTTPASLAFGADDPCSLYVTELYGDTVWRIPTAYTGAVVPAWEAAR